LYLVRGKIPASKEDDRNVVPLFKKFAELVKSLPGYRPAAYIKRLGGDPTPEKSARIDKINKSARNYIQRFDKFSKGRLLCLTEKGHLAWVPQFTVVGDQIYAFRYCRIPFVLLPPDGGLLSPWIHERRAISSSA
jgi:hypothetical protein